MEKQACSPSGPCQGTSSQTVDEKLTSVTYDDEGFKSLELERIEDYNLIVPSYSHLNKTVDKNSTKKFYDLSKLVYDESLDEYVYQVDGYSIGDVIQFEDEIVSIDYYDDTNTTKIGFQGIEGIERWEFDGDLRKQYSIVEDRDILINAY